MRSRIPDQPSQETRTPVSTSTPATSHPTTTPNPENLARGVIGQGSDLTEMGGCIKPH